MRPDEMTLEEQLIASIAVANHRKEQENPMDKVLFETNVPQTLALKYARGKRVESRYNEYEVYYSTTDGRALYASPALDAKITACSPGEGELFTICKREIKDGQRKRIEWQVALATDGAAAAAAPVKEEPARQVRTAAPVAAVKSHTASEVIDAPIVAQPLSQTMAGALIAAIDALAVARDYGVKKGFALEFNEEDVRTTAASLFIAATRNQDSVRVTGAAAMQAMQRVNGGVQ